MELVLLIGIQATGKSTFCRQRFSETHVRLNLDMLRTRHREWLLFSACLEAGQPVVIDNTNPTRAERDRYVRPAIEAGFSVVGYFFESRLRDAIRRNSSRPEVRRVPDRGIVGTSNRLERPAFDEGFRDLFFIRIHETSGGFDVEEWRDEI